MVAPRTYLRVARQFWWLIVAGFVIGAGLGLLAHKALPATYSATNLVVVKPGDADTLSDLTGSTTLVTSTASNLAALATAEPVLAEIASRAGVPVAEVTPKAIEVTLPSNTAMLAITATASSPQRAAIIANAAGEVLATRLEVISPQGAGRQVMHLRQVAPATAPSESTAPPRGLLLVAGAVIGAAIGFVVGLVRLTLGARLRDENALADVTDSPVLGTIDASRYPFNSQSRDQFAVLLRRSGVLEDDGIACRTVAVVSTDTGSERTSVALGLATAAADAGRRVLVIEGAAGAVPGAPWSSLASGLCEVLDGSVALTQALIPLADGRARALPYGGRPVRLPSQPDDVPRRGPGLLLKSTEIREALADQFDLIFIGTGQLTPDAPEVSFVDDAIVVVHLGATQRGDLCRALDRFDDTQLQGIALTRGTLAREAPVEVVKGPRRRHR